jgi:hypothetical protein
MASAKRSLSLSSGGTLPARARFLYGERKYRLRFADDDALPGNGSLQAARS